MSSNQETYCTSNFMQVGHYKTIVSMGIQDKALLFGRIKGWKIQGRI